MRHRWVRTVLGMNSDSGAELLGPHFAMMLSNPTVLSGEIDTRQVPQHKDDSHIFDFSELLIVRL